MTAHSQIKADRCCTSPFYTPCGLLTILPSGAVQVSYTERQAEIFRAWCDSYPGWDDAIEEWVRAENEEEAARLLRLSEPDVWPADPSATYGGHWYHYIALRGD